MNMTIEVEDTDSLVEVKVGGEIDAYTAPKLRENFFQFLKKMESK